MLLLFDRLSSGAHVLVVLCEVAIVFQVKSVNPLEML